MRANLNSTINTQCRFPKNIFLGRWSNFFFFDSDWIFDEKFTSKCRELLKKDGGQSAIIVNLDAKPGVGSSSFLVESETTDSEYQSFLVGASVGKGWLHSVDRFGCTSDVTEWCIYCEKRNEIAVFAVRSLSLVEKYKGVISQLKALPIDQAISIPLSYGFSDRVLSEEWRNELLRQYADLNLSKAQTAR
jgi:hypothetical protein